MKNLIKHSNFKEDNAGVANIILEETKSNLDSGGGSSGTINLTPIGEDLSVYATDLGEGTHLDDKGNLVKSNGAIVKTKDDLTSFLASKNVVDTTEIIQIGEVDYKLDANGNALDTEGKIFKTKEELTALEEIKDGATNDDGTLSIEEIEKISGYQVLDEIGQPKTFEATPQGLADREVALVAQEVSKIVSAYPTTFLQNNSDIADMLHYKDLYGSLEGYSNRIDYGKLTVDEKNETQLFNLVIEAEKASGKNITEATEIATMWKDANKLIEKGKNAFEFLKQRQINVEDQLKANKEIARNKAIVDNKIYWEQVQTTILTKDTIAGITIPKTIPIKDAQGAIVNMTRPQIYEYMSKPVVKGSDGTVYSQYHVDKYNTDQAKTFEDNIIDAILLLTKKDYKSLIDAGISDHKVKDIIKRKFKLPTSEGSYQSGANKGVDNIKV